MVGGFAEAVKHRAHTARVFVEDGERVVPRCALVDDDGQEEFRGEIELRAECCGLCDARGGVVLGAPVTYEYTVDGVHCRSEFVIPPGSPSYLKGSSIGSSIPIYVERSQPCINYALRRPILTTVLISGVAVACIGLVVILSAWSS